MTTPADAPPPAAPPTAAAAAPEPDARLKDLETQTKRFAQQQRKFSEERAKFDKERAEHGGSLKEHQEWKQLHADRKRNPVKYLAQDYGDDWYDKLTRIKLEGAATPDLIASELDSRLGDFEKKLSEKEKAIDERFQKLQYQENERATQEHQQEVFKYVRSNASKYALLNETADDGSERAVWGEIENHFRETAKKSDDGRGELLTAEKAADIVEARLEKFAAKLLAATQRKNKATPGSTQQPARRDTPERRSPNEPAAHGEKPMTESERMKRSIAAWEHTLSQRQ